MRNLSSSQLRIGLTAFTLLAEIALLLWEHFHGGIVSHHILHRADLPSISNAWGLLVLPALVWFASTQVLPWQHAQHQQAHKNMQSNPGTGFAKLPRSAILGFCGALIIGCALAFGFSHGFKTFTEYLFQLMLLLVVLLPAYRAETLLGFVLGMNVVFGAILPTAIGAILAAISAISHLVLWPLLVRGWRWCARRLA